MTAATIDPAVVERVTAWSAKRAAAAVGRPPAPAIVAPLEPELTWASGVALVFAVAALGATVLAMVPATLHQAATGRLAVVFAVAAFLSFVAPFLRIETPRFVAWVRYRRAAAAYGRPPVGAAPAQPVRIALVAISPTSTARLADGSQLADVRRLPLRRATTHVLFYATSPVRRIVGAASVRAASSGAPEGLWRSFRGQLGMARSEYLALVGDRAPVQVVEFESVVMFATPVPLADVAADGHAPRPVRYLSSVQVAAARRVAVRDARQVRAAARLEQIVAARAGRRAALATAYAFTRPVAHPRRGAR